MNLKTVTFAGVDDRINLDDLTDLSMEFPFVEWGILLSLNSEQVLSLCKPFVSEAV